MTLTPHQFRLLDAMQNIEWLTGAPPTLQQLGDYFGRTKVSIFELMRELVRKGAVVQTAAGHYRVAAGIALPRGSRLRWPVVGTVGPEGIKVRNNFLAFPGMSGKRNKGQ